jgi:hypothetical protein
VKSSSERASDSAISGRSDRSAPPEGAVVVWVNGERCDSSSPHVSARDRGLTLADGLFETMRVRRGQVFRLDRHLARLRDGLFALGIPPRRSCEPGFIPLSTTRRPRTVRSG